MWYQRPGIWEEDLARYSLFLKHVFDQGQRVARDRILREIDRIYSYWTTRFRARALFLEHNSRVPSGPDFQVADSISPPGGPEDYFEFTPLQLYEIFYS